MSHRLIALALALTLAGCAPKAAEKAEAPAEPSAPQGVVKLSVEVARTLGVVTEAVVKRRVAVRQDVLGQIAYRPEAETVVHVPVAGQVTAVSVKVGDVVGAGAPLLTLRSAERAGAQAAYLKALGEARLAARADARARQLYKAELASKQELDEAAQKREAADLAVMQASQALRVLGYGDGELASLARRGRVALDQVITAPRAGTVAERHVALGEVVSPAHEAPLVRLLDLSVVRVEADLPERDLLAVRPGQTAQVALEALGDRAVTGRVVGLSPVVDPSTRTGKALVDVPNPGGRLRPGMSCRVRIETGQREMLVVPDAALQEESGKAYVYQPLGDGAYQETAVKLGARLDGGVEVVSGLAPGAVVVTKGSFDLRSQARKAMFGGE